MNLQKLINVSRLKNAEKSQRIEDFLEQSKQQRVVWEKIKQEGDHERFLERTLEALVKCPELGNMASFDFHEEVCRRILLELKKLNNK